MKKPKSPPNDASAYAALLERAMHALQHDELELSLDWTARMRLLSELPSATAGPDERRRGALGHIRQAVCQLAEAAQRLADRTAPKAEVDEAVSIADRVRAALEGGGELDTRAKLELIDYIGMAAHALMKGVPPEAALRFTALVYEARWPEYATRLDRGAFRLAVEKWVACESGRRNTAKWEPIAEAVRTALGSEPGTVDPQMLRSEWLRERRRERSRQRARGIANPVLEPPDPSDGQ